MKTPTLAIAIALIACHKDNPNYCPGNPENNCNIDAALELDTSHGCSGPADCPGMVCDLATAACVQCTTGMATACTGTTPVCGSDDTCQACSSDTQCASNTCLPDGSCADGANVLYASSTGGDAATCGPADKCSIAHAIALAAAPKNTVKLDSGTYSLAATLSLAKDIRLIGAGAILDRTGAGTGATISVSGTKTIELDELTIQGGDDPSIGYGIGCTTATLIARMVTIQNNAGSGINSVGCNVTVARSTIYNNTGGGISLSGTGVAFDLTNNFIIRNGDLNNGSYGGVDLGVTSPGQSRFELNTIADNHASTGLTHSGGVICDISGFGAPNNVIARNSIDLSTTASNAQTLGICTYPTSLVQSDVSGLAFVSSETSPYNYRLGAGSTAIDAATTASTVDIDVDGDVRPQGAARDMGADEYTH